MKNLLINNQFKVFNFNEETNKKALYLALILPLACMIFLLEWEPRVLVFIFLGYSCSVIGFLLARTMIEKNQLLGNEDHIYRMLAGHINEVVIIHRMEDNSNIFVSPSIHETLGFSPDEIICKYGTYLIHPDDRREVIRQLNLDALRQKPHFTSTLRIQKKDTTYIWMELSGKAILDAQGQVEYTILSFRDATQRKESEEMTRRLSEELMRKHTELKSKKNKQVDLSSLMCSHDLKEPLRTIKSYIEILNYKYKHLLDDPGKECLHYIKDGASRMSDMLQDIKAYSSIGGHSARKRPVDLRPLFQETLQLLDAKIKTSRAIITQESLPTIAVDVRQFRHLLQNLIDNGIKYAGAERPQLHLGWEKKNGFWEFRLSDQGIGIPEAFQETIFEVFHRLHGAGEISGSGIGLAICKKIVDNHGGQLWVESAGRGSGSTFVFTIPIAEGHQPALQRLYEADLPAEGSWGAARG